ncbi:MAG: transcriptional regulator [Chloroflexi bacterium]|nr:MAG: transcriptional regulator [Chloroflexota bacterium]
MDRYHQVALFLKALAHPVRLSILEALRDEGQYVQHLTHALGRRQANVSQHLAVLREAGLVTAQREGMNVIYRLKDRRVLEVLDAAVGIVADMHPEAFAQTQPYPRRRRGGCGCPRCRRGWEGS